MFHVFVDFQEKCEEAVKLCKDHEEKIYSLQTESKKFEMELDAAIREKVTYRKGYLELFIWYSEMVYVGLII